MFGSLPVPVFLLSAAVAAWALALIRLINYDFGYEVSTAIDGVDAFDQLMKVSPPDVLIADLAMPRMTGWELAIKLRGKPGYATMPIIAMSAAGLERRSPVSFDAFLPKPFSIEALEDALHSVARAAKLHCQLPASAILLQING